MTRIQLLLTLIMGSIALALSMIPAHAANCAARAVVLDALTTDFSETRQSIGLADNGQVVETFASEDGSWTVIVTNTAGISCVVASGQSFENLSEDLPPRGAPA